MKHTVDRRVLATACVALLVAGCSQAGSLPFAGNSSVGASASQARFGVSSTLEPAQVTPEEGVAGSNSTPPCKVFPNICVDQGGSATLGIKLTCMKGGKKIKCGSVKWFAKMSNKGLTWSFKPNPGNPTTETVHASATIKVGKYSQAISTKCSNVPNCPKDYMAAIYVQK